MKLTKIGAAKLHSKLKIVSGQNKRGGVVSAGLWFNGAGERIGWGDVTLADLVNIQKELDEGEVFIVLLEGAEAGFDHEKLPKEYIAQQARLALTSERLLVFEVDEDRASSDREWLRKMMGLQS